MTAISTGGGMIEVQEIDGATVSMAGDYVETLVFVTEGAEGLATWLRERANCEDLVIARLPVGVVQKMHLTEQNGTLDCGRVLAASASLVDQQRLDVRPPSRWFRLGQFPGCKARLVEVRSSAGRS